MRSKMETKTNLSAAPQFWNHTVGPGTRHYKFLSALGVTFGTLLVSHLAGFSESAMARLQESK